MLFLVICSCGHDKYSKTNKIKNVDVCYIKGSISPQVPFACGQIGLMNSELVKDTILTDKALLKKIENEINILEKSVTSFNQTYCDIRVQCILNYYNNSSKRLCIGEFNCIKLNNNGYGKNDSLSYLIKRNSGYYNYFNKNALEYFREVQQFGVPNDYKFIVN